MTEATFTLVHTSDDGTQLTQPVTVRANGNFLEVTPHGYGERAAADGAGAPVVLDLTPDGLRVHVFADINSEEPTETVPLEGASETQRRRWFLECTQYGHTVRGPGGFVRREAAEAALAAWVSRGLPDSNRSGVVVPADE